MAAREIPGVLLAGGLARRMGGGDKPMRSIAGRTILERAVARLSTQCSCLILNANGDLARFALIAERNDFRARHGYIGKTEHFDRQRGARRIDRIARLIEQRANTAEDRSGQQNVSTLQRSRLDEHGRNRTASAKAASISSSLLARKI